MELPAPVLTAILKTLGMPDLDFATARTYRTRLHGLRAQMQALSDDFARRIPTTSAYAPAYFAYHFPMNFMKVRYAVQHLITLFADPFKAGRMKILDIGCGEGAALLGALFALGPERKASYHGYDASHAMVKQGRALLRALTEGHALPRILIEHRDVADGLLRTPERYDIILLSNSLIEIAPEVPDALRYIERIAKNLSEHGFMIVIEPALVTTSRRLMELRDGIIAKQKLRILLPCLHEGPCPLLGLRGGKEWCHQSLPWKAPAYMHILNQGLNREMNILKFSYLILSRNGRVAPDGYPVISPLLKEKGRKRCYLCSPACRIELVRLNKHRSTRNRDFDRIMKGDIVSLGESEHRRPDHIAVTAATRVRIVSRARSM